MDFSEIESYIQLPLPGSQEILPEYDPLDPHKGGVRAYMMEDDILERQRLATGMLRSSAVVQYHWATSRALNELYQRIPVGEASSAISRGRELFDRISQESGQHVDSRRHTLDAILIRGGPSDVAKKFPEIRVLQEEIPDDHAVDRCYAYAFGFSGMDFMTFLETDEGKSFQPILPVPGAVVLYYFDQEFPSHAGILTHEGRVRSRWGRDAVVEHPIDFVPTYYGKVETFLTRDTQ
ncbi:MAG: hypothetical protein Q8Q49_02320 [bacterium]|nr:hypothetical protein [bacterium]